MKKNRSTIPANVRDMLLKVNSEEDDEEFVTAYTWLIADKSGSVRPKEDKVYQALIRTFSGLAEANQGALDVISRIKLALFDGDIRDFNSVHLPPEQLADTFTPDDFRCGGSTNMGAVFRYIDKELSRSSAVVQGLKKNTPMFNFILITDGQANDPASLRETARKLLDSNRFYRDYCRVLVVFLGEEQDMDTAVALANGKKENVVALTNDLIPLLAPVLIGSTVTFTDGTHLSTDGSDNNMANLVDQAKKREQDGSESADEISDDQLREDLLRLMGKAS